MTTHERCIERLSEYLDGDLEPGEERRVAEHLAACPACSRVRAELEDVVRRAQALPERPPARDLWPGVAAAIGVRGAVPVPMLPAPTSVRRLRPRRRVSFTVPQLAAAGLALALASGATAWLARSPGRPVLEASATSPSGDGSFASFPGEAGYAAEVARLETALSRSGDLDAATVRVLQRNLEIIDRAIRECRQALASDPGNPYLEEHLIRTYQRKVETLRTVATAVEGPRS